MKKCAKSRLACIFFLFAFLCSVAGQNRSEIGVLLNPGVATVFDDHDKNYLENARLTLGFGINLEQLVIADKVAVQIGCLYRSRGFQQERQYFNLSGLPAEIHTYYQRNVYITAPLIIKYYLNDFFLGLGVEAGVMAARHDRLDGQSIRNLGTQGGLQSAFIAKGGWRHQIFNRISLLLELEYNDVIKDSFSNLNLGLGLNYEF